MKLNFSWLPLSNMFSLCYTLALNHQVFYSFHNSPAPLYIYHNRLPQLYITSLSTDPAPSPVYVPFPSECTAGLNVPRVLLDTSETKLLRDLGG